MSEGRILYQGAPVAPRGPLDAIRAGIRVVNQEFNLLPFLSVAENVFFERLPRRYGLVDRRRLEKETERLLEEVGLSVSPRARVEDLGVAQMQLVPTVPRTPSLGEGPSPWRLRPTRAWAFDQNAWAFSPR